MSRQQERLFERCKALNIPEASYVQNDLEWLLEDGSITKADIRKSKLHFKAGICRRIEALVNEIDALEELCQDYNDFIKGFLEEEK